MPQYQILGVLLTPGTSSAAFPGLLRLQGLPDRRGDDRRTILQHAWRKTKNAPTGIDEVVLAISVALEDIGAFVELTASISIAGRCARRSAAVVDDVCRPVEVSAYPRLLAQERMKVEDTARDLRKPTIHPHACAREDPPTP